MMLLLNTYVPPFEVNKNIYKFEFLKNNRLASKF